MSPVLVEAVTAVLTFIIVEVVATARVDFAVEAAGVQTQSQLGWCESRTFDR